MPDPEEAGSWVEYRKLIVEELKNLRNGQNEANNKLDGLRREVHAAIGAIQNEQISKMWSEIAVLKFKAGVWGLAAGAIPGVVAALFFAMSGKH